MGQVRAHFGIVSGVVRQCWLCGVRRELWSHAAGIVPRTSLSSLFRSLGTLYNMNSNWIICHAMYEIEQYKLNIYTSSRSDSKLKTTRYLYSSYAAQQPTIELAQPSMHPSFRRRLEHHSTQQHTAQQPCRNRRPNTPTIAIPIRPPVGSTWPDKPDVGVCIGPL